MLWKGKLLILLIWLVASAGGFFAVMHMQPRYRAETLVLVESQKIPDKYVASTVTGDVQDRLATINQEILSATRLKTIIDDFKLYPQERKQDSLEDVIDLMRKDVEVQLDKGWSNNRPGAFRISYEGADPRVVAAVTNRLASLYIDENLKVREVEAEGTSQFMDAQLQDAKKTLDDLETAISRYKVQHNGELPEQEVSINNSLGRLQTELQGTQDSIDRAQQNQIMYDAELGSIQSRLGLLTAPPPASGAANSAQAVLVTEAPKPVKPSQALSEQLRILRARYSDAYPEVIRVKAELAAALKAEEQQQQQQPSAAAAPAPTAPAHAPREVRLTPEIAREVDQLQQRAATLQAARTVAVHDIETGNAQRANILQQINAYQEHLKHLPLREQELAGLTRDYEISKANYRSLLDKKMSADMATEMERRQKAERFIVLDPAQVPEKPFKPKRPLLISLASVMGLALGAALALGREWNKGVLLGEWELPPGVKVLGRVPAIEIGRTTDPGRPRRLKAKALATTISTLLLAGIVTGCRLTGVL